MIDGVAVTYIDNGMSVVAMRDGDFGKIGYELPSEIKSDDDLKTRIESPSASRRTHESK